jgi:signal transduction histidine kinase
VWQPWGSPDWTFWQCFAGRRAGVDGRVDRNVFRGTEDDLRALAERRPIEEVIAATTTDRRPHPQSALDIGGPIAERKRMEQDFQGQIDQATAGLSARARAFGYPLGGLILIAAGILHTWRGWVLIAAYAAMVAGAVYHIAKPGPLGFWTTYRDLLVPPVTALLVGQDPASMHLLVAAQVGGILLAPRSKHTLWLGVTAAVGIVAGMALEGTTPLIPLPPGGYVLANRGAVVLGMLLGMLLVTVLLNRNWSNQRRLAAYAERERRSAEVQKHLVSVVSHELRTPIASIVGFSELMATESELGDEERSEFATTINAEAGHLSRLVDDLVDHLKLELDRISVRSEPFDAAEVVRRLVLGNETRGREVSGGDIPDRAPVIADPDRLYQIVRNLIDNAVRYGGDVIRVGIDSRDDTVEIWVHDNGPGLPPGRVDELFAEYAQAQTGRGLGLGLSISRRLAEAMGGTLTYDAAASPGARFVVTLQRDGASTGSSSAEGPAPISGPSQAMLRAG